MSSAVSTVARSTSHPYLPSPASSVGYPYYPRKHIAPPPLSLQKVQKTSLANEAALHGGGLRTPPAEDGMGTTYQHNPVLSSTYDSHVALARQPNGLGQASRPGVSLCDAALNQVARPQPVPIQQQHLQPQAQHQFPHQQQHHITHQQQQQQQPPSHLQQVVHHASSLAPPSTTSRHSTRPSTPSSTASTSQHHERTVPRRDSTLVMHSLQLPACISPNGGNLDDFAALMTCFFWFENMETIDAAEQVKERPTTSAVPPLTTYTRPCPAYKKWVHTILTTTQVTQNVILLALLFVYRLKSTNPKVNGSPGSEYRLLTVALMLGNKFLDDNTYTNKTWAEVSGIAVKEIHVMEVEFLSNMRYGLLTSKEQWADWLKKLSCFHDYCERAEMTERTTAAELARRQRVSSLQANGASPTHRGFSPPLPSPTNALAPTVQGAPAPLNAYSPNAAVYHSHQWQAQGPFQSTPALSPLAAKPSMGFPESRKRSLEGGEMMEPAAKRVTRQTPANMPSGPVQPPQAATESVRLPVPRLALDTQSVSTPAAYGQPSNYSQAPVSLPPLGTNVRSMATVYPNATTWAPQVPIAATCGPQTPAYAAPPSNFGTPTKRHSPRGGLAIYSSPLADAYNGHHTPIANSPSVFLQQRNSPYKPVRPVNTLNYPPPSSSLSEYHLGSAQMHYQPLGHRNVRTGIVPDFLPGYGNARPMPVPTSQAPGQHYHA